MSNKKEVEDTHISAFGAQSGSRPCQQEKEKHEFLIWREGNHIDIVRQGGGGGRTSW